MYGEDDCRSNWRKDVGILVVVSGIFVVFLGGLRVVFVGILLVVGMKLVCIVLDILVDLVGILVAVGLRIVLVDRWSRVDTSKGVVGQFEPPGLWPAER